MNKVKGVVGNGTPKTLQGQLNNEKNVEVIELCSGIGLTSIALKNACDKIGIGMKINACCEIDKFASKAYSALHDENIPNLEDITIASFKDMRCDILLATTPCTNISKMGNRKGFKEGSDTSSAIIWSVFRIIDELKEKPKIVFFENVSAMVDAKNIENFNSLKRRLEVIGYEVRYKILDAQDFNVPQHRERIYIVCILKDLYCDFDFPKREVLKVFLKDILEKNASPKFLMPTIANQILSANERGYSFRIHNPSSAKVAYTITTKSRGQNTNNYVFIEDASSDDVVRITPKSNNKDLVNYPIRSFTRLEMGRLMGMKDEEIRKLDFISNTQFSKQMGNGIVIDVVEKIFFNVLMAIYKKDIDKEVA